ncbi:HAMP domain-containing protein [Mobilitalea sibirica]|uniref:histidine kinase n=1 Tax=Mobilitalea sibirica TaxID=1462919 RepID=A0A8J7HAN9_9FIRM|nr:ATP-binding protein [Mobilitalea sibirica]MBH1940151.1 HAMP domain-containing protein [Mobilitalea sibirica]
MKKISTKLTSAMFVLVLFTVSVISFSSNHLINKQFTQYISRQQQLREQIITSSLSQQYARLTDQWNLDYIHTIGMFSLYEGYILKVYDNEENILWDAQAHDMELCNRIIADISKRMRIKYPQMEGEFTAISYPLTQSGIVIGSVSISHFGPFFLSENDFRFLDSLNKVLLGVGFISLIMAVFLGNLIARRISHPILKTIDITKEIADGNYQVRLKEAANSKELNMLITSVNHLASSLETLEKLRKQLTEDVAHELRTPITILQSHIEAIIEGVWEPNTEWMQSCYDETIRIGKLVDDLEQLARIESSNLNLNKKEYLLKDLIQKTVTGFEGELFNQNRSINVLGPEVSVRADYDRLQQVLINLISNAVKYSKEKGNIIIEVFEAENNVGFHVKDDGIGIPEEELPFIFERFYRADKSRNRLTGGTGIGLTIVKSIIEAHGGRILLKSKLHEGSVFTVILPKN